MKKNQIYKKDRLRVETTLNKLQKIMEEIQEYNPNALLVYSQSSCTILLTTNGLLIDDLSEAESALDESVQFSGMMDSCY